MGVIAFHRDLFHCGRYAYRPNQVGRLIVESLLQGTEQTSFGGGGIATVNYLVGMLRHVGRGGTDFFDAYDWTIRSHDHDFDPNVPTPGTNWGEIQELRARARVIAYESRDIRDSSALWSLSPAFAAIAQDMRDTADQLDVTKHGLRPLRDAITVPSAKCWNRQIGTNAIWWDGQVFKFGGYSVSPAVVGRMIAATLLRGEEWVLVGEQSVTVNYLVQMCREVGKHGEFADYTDESDFDPNVAPDMSPDA
jgi:hypothetical protein